MCTYFFNDDVKSFLADITKVCDQYLIWQKKDSDWEHVSQLNNCKIVDSSWE